MNEIFVIKTHLDEIISHSREVFPKEACGILAGRGNAVERVYRMKNADDSPFTYRFDPGEQLRVMREIERDGLRLLGIYHSHTGSPAYPSATDVERAFFPGTKEESYPGVVFLIVSLADGEPETNAFLINRDGIEQVRISEE